MMKNTYLNIQAAQPISSRVNKKIKKSIIFRKNIQTSLRKSCKYPKNKRCIVYRETGIRIIANVSSEKMVSGISYPEDIFK